MTEPVRPAGMMIGWSDVDRVWDAGLGLSVPAAIQIDDSEDVAAYPHPVPDATTVRLVPSLHGLTDDVVRELLEILVGIEGIRPSEVPTPAPREVSVPLLAPSTITDDQIAWTITDQLSLVHADRQDVYFALAETTADTATRPHVDPHPGANLAANPRVDHGPLLAVRTQSSIRCRGHPAAHVAAARQRHPCRPRHRCPHLTTHAATGQDPDHRVPPMVWPPCTTHSRRRHSEPR